MTHDQKDLFPFEAVPEMEHYLREKWCYDLSDGLEEGKKSRLLGPLLGRLSEYGDVMPADLIATEEKSWSVLSDYFDAMAAIYSAWVCGFDHRIEISFWGALWMENLYVDDDDEWATATITIDREVLMGLYAIRSLWDVMPRESIENVYVGWYVNWISTSESHLSPSELWCNMENMWRFIGDKLWDVYIPQRSSARKVCVPKMPCAQWRWAPFPDSDALVSLAKVM